MNLKCEIFSYVFNWLLQEGMVKSQKDLYLKTKIREATISNVLRGNKEPGNDTLKKLNDAFGGIFNMSYLQGRSAIMLKKDVEYFKAHPDEFISKYGKKALIDDRIGMISIPKEDDCETPQTTGTPEIDQSSLVNAALAAKDKTIEAKDELIASLREQLKAKDELTESLKDQLATTRELATSLRDQLNAANTLISNLKAQLNNTDEQILSNYPFPTGVAETKNQKISTKI